IQPQGSGCAIHAVALRQLGGFRPYPLRQWRAGTIGTSPLLQPLAYFQQWLWDRVLFTRHDITYWFAIASVTHACRKLTFKAGDSVAAIIPTGGGYATHVLIPAATAIPIPNHVDSALAAAMLMQGVTAYIVLDQAQVKDGDVELPAS